jgi:hypothetical protein
MEKVIREERIPPAGYFAAELKKAQVLRIVDVQALGDEHDQPQQTGLPAGGLSALLG